MFIIMWTNIPNTFILREIRSKRRSTLISVIVLGMIIISFFFSYAAFGQQNNQKETLVSVHILFRHGDRTPTFFFPNDPNYNKDWSEEPGRLTNKGKSQMYHLGKLIRSLYSHLLPDLYYSKDLLVKSSYSPRCQMSAATLLAGLYPPVDSQIWNEKLLWQPIPVNPIPRDKDNLIAAKVKCPAFTKEKKKSDEEIMNELTTEQKKIFEYMTNHSGMNISDISKAESLYYTLSIESNSGFSLPSWTKNIYPEPLKTFATLNLASFTRTDQLKRLQSGPLLGEWLSNLESSQIGDSSLVYLYSGHDLTIVNTMRSLGLMHQEKSWLPEYGASLLLELIREMISEEKPTFFIKLLYLNSSSSENPTELKLPNCDVNCPLQRFKQLVKPLIPYDWEKECNDLA